MLTYDHCEVEKNSFTHSNVQLKSNASKQNMVSAINKCKYSKANVGLGVQNLLPYESKFDITLLLAIISEPSARHCSLFLFFIIDNELPLVQSLIPVLLLLLLHEIFWVY